MDESKHHFTTRTLHSHRADIMQTLVWRRMLQTAYSMPMGRRLASLSRGSISSRFPPAAYTTNLSSSSIRPASSSSGSSAEERTHVFVIWAPDYTDKDAPVRRLAVRETHLHETKPGQETGYYCELFVTTNCLKLTPPQCSVVPSLPLSRLLH